MDIEKIMNDLDNNLILTFHIDVTQNNIDQLIEYCIKNNLKEKAWRIALSFPNGIDYLMLAKYYIENKDAWYLGELLYVIDNVEFSAKVYTYVLKTNDNDFIEKISIGYMNYYNVKTKEELNILLNNNGK